MNKKIVCSWSGGKDSCFALYKMKQNGWIPYKLFTMFKEDGERSRSHALPISVLSEQAKSMNIELEKENATWDNYEKIFIKKLINYKKEGIENIVFGDIDLEQHKEWEKMVCKKANLNAHLPLWKLNRKSLPIDFIKSGFKATIIAVKDSILDKSFLGKELNEQLINKLIDNNIDPSAEGGEFHTIVTDGPLFNYKIKLDFKEIVSFSGYSFLKTN
ncbi:ATP pyrophosphatase [Tepiditoga spiralis]|uniref:ATP pyrophosphatase n=1 Tax=Tepiditoga spiralis TaxID=2108365 RepID=A0A7G1G535_9BACT|nr:diphthine--ammonia ligase [Tepiditoga spiralis]BBE31670.1 ATP pyrophosphatase [Tepiditoga spiralis]